MRIYKRNKSILKISNRKTSRILPISDSRVDLNQHISKHKKLLNLNIMSLFPAGHHLSRVSSGATTTDEATEGNLMSCRC